MPPKKRHNSWRAYFPQKLAQKTSIETRYKPFQRRVSIYILKISKSCFVWATPPLRTGAIIKNRKETYLAAVGNRTRQEEVQNVTRAENI
jgi:hypothetical protein